MIDWASFAVVAAASLVGACVLVFFAAVGFRLLDSSRAVRAASVGAWACFAVCAATVLFGVYLIVPIFHGS